jgi:hypothetical protein
VAFYSLAGVKCCQWSDASPHTACGAWVREKCPQHTHFANGTYLAKVTLHYDGRTESGLAKFVVLK